MELHEGRDDQKIAKIEMGGEILDPKLANDLESAAEHYAGSWADSTRKAYGSDLKDFHAYCEDRSVSALPATPITVAGYLAALAGGDWGRPRKLATITRRLAAIGFAHREAALPDPTDHPKVKGVLRGLRRQLTVKQGRKSPLRTDHIRKMVEKIGKSPRSRRDKALLLIAFSTGCRASELVRIYKDQVIADPHGLVVEIAKSKTDQDGHGAQKLIRYGTNPKTCPVRALQEWIEFAGITSGPIFRSIDRGEEIGDAAMSTLGVSRAIKRAVSKIGLNPAFYSSHSARAGYVSEADSRGARASDIMAQTQHKTPQMLAVYTRHNVTERFESSTALDLGL